MGIYTSNRFFGEAYDYASEIPANEAYDAAFGCAHILADCQRNDMALFESSIFDDIAEVKAIQEGTGYVNENAFTNVIKKIVEMFKKLLAKIKGIFKAFLTKLTGAFIDGKKLVQKYEKQIIKYSNWDGLKIKGIRKPKNGKENIRESIDSMFTGKNISNSYTIKLSGNLTNSGNTNSMLVDTQIDGIKTEEDIDKAESEDIKEKLAKEYIKGVSISDYKDIDKDIMDALFEDEDTLDDEIKSASFFSSNWIKTILSQGEEWEKEIKKFNDKLDKNINTTIDNLKKTDDNLAKFMVNNKDANVHAFKARKAISSYGSVDNDGKVQKNTTDEFIAQTEHSYGIKPEKIQKAIHALQKLAGNEQEVITKVTSEYMSVVKFSLAQARKIWTAAAAWSSGVHKESVEYYQTLGEAAAEEFYMNMEAVC